MDIVLDPVEVRVLGCLIEKDMATPEYYPMTLNAVVNACNQKSNRDPVVSYDEDIVGEAMHSLRGKGLVSVLTGGSNRVPKYSHRMQDVLNLGRRELALLCELMVRGPQTTGELRGSAARMHRFSDVEEVEACMRTLMEHPKGPLTVLLPRQAGRKEPRYAHLLAGEPDVAAEAADTGSPVARPGLEGRVAALEAEVAELRAQLSRVLGELGLS